MIKNKIFFLIGMFLIIGLALFLIIILYPNSPLEEIEGEYLEQEIIENCKNMNLFDTSNCISSSISKIFFYNLSNQNISTNAMSFSKLKEEGGTCKHYNKYIEQIGESLGFSSEHKTLLPEIKHGFSILYDNKTKDYCVLDMNKLVGCMNLK